VQKLELKMRQVSPLLNAAQAFHRCFLPCLPGGGQMCACCERWRSSNLKVRSQIHRARGSWNAGPRSQVGTHDLFHAGLISPA